MTDVPPLSDHPISPDHSISPDHPRRPALLVLDVNETLSDMAPLSARFEDVGAPAHLATLWFAELLRDGFAVTAAGGAEPFAVLAAEVLRPRLGEHSLDRGLDEAVDHVMQGFSALEVHPDVAPGVRALGELDIRLVTLSNGSAAVADTLLEGAGLRDAFERLLTVEDAGVWKPAAGAYVHALTECGVAPAEAMLVAVHPWDVHGAAQAGLATAWVDRTGGGRYPSYFAEPTLTVRSLVELADVLSRGSGA